MISLNLPTVCRLKCLQRLQIPLGREIDWYKFENREVGKCWYCLASDTEFDCSRNFRKKISHSTF